MTNAAVPERTSKEKQTSKGFFSWFTLGVFLTAMTVCLTLMGYGYDLGFLDRFGLAPEHLQRSPMDFLLRSYRAIFSVIEMNMFIEKRLGWRLMGDWLEKVGDFMTIACVTAGVIAFAFTRRGKGLIRRAAGIARSGRTGSALARTGVRLATIRSSISTRERLFCYGWPLSVAAVFLAAPFVVGALLWIVFATFIVLSTGISLKPAQWGGKAADANVIAPERCAISRGVLPHGFRGAYCVRVLRQDCEIARGRYIEQSGNRVWLLHKQPSWQVFSVPLDGHTVEETDAEVAPKGTILCSSKP